MSSSELEKLNALGAAPMLFVGAGLSRRYLGLDAWRDLLARFAKYTSKTVDYYLSAADGKYPRAGSILADFFHEVWWSADEFAESRKEYSHLAAEGRELPLKIEVARYMRGAAVTESPDLREELSVLANAQIDTVVTTNYDNLIETLYPDFQAYVGQRSLLFAPLHGVAEIYKVHGSATDPASIVLTEADYARMRQQNAYLVAKLATMLVERPVVFLGYSLGDDYIRDILSEFVGCLDDGQIQTLSERVFFVEYVANAKLSVTDSHFSFGEGRPALPMVRIRASDFAPIYSALGSFRRELPARVLRLLKERC